MCICRDVFIVNLFSWIWCILPTLIYIIILFKNITYDKKTCSAFALLCRIPAGQRCSSGNAIDWAALMEYQVRVVSFNAILTPDSRAPYELVLWVM